MMFRFSLLLLLATCEAFSTHQKTSLVARDAIRLDAVKKGAAVDDGVGRRAFLTTSAAAIAFGTAGWISCPPAADAVGPVKLSLKPFKYNAKPCPPNKPIPGQAAMRGMRGLCVTVDAELLESPPKDLEKVGVYGFVTDGDTGDSVLANNPDLSTDAGQFAMIETIGTSDKKVSVSRRRESTHSL